MAGLEVVDVVGIVLDEAEHLAPGGGDFAAAGSQMFGFIKNYPNNIHYFEACQLLGDLLVAKGAYAAAQTYYAKLASSPFEDLKMRRASASARAVETGEDRRGAEGVRRRVGQRDEQRAGRVGALRGETGQGPLPCPMKRSDEAVRMAEEIIAKADAKDEALMADAYITVGIAYRQANRPKDALLAFLHVDVVYDNVPELHAEALANLIDVFLELHKPGHSGDCKQRLLKEYPNSPWAKRRGEATGGKGAAQDGDQARRSLDRIRLSAVHRAVDHLGGANRAARAMPLLPRRRRRSRAKPKQPQEGYLVAEGVDQPPLRHGISFTCRVCRTRLTVGEEEAGGEVVCPDCGVRCRSLRLKRRRKERRRRRRANTPSARTTISPGPTPTPRRHPPFCGLCGTLMRAAASEVGAKLICPDSAPPPSCRR